jgi:cell division protein FtsB
VTARVWLAAGVVLAAAVFAVQGGEYSVLEWLELERDERAETARIARLEREIDSLADLARRVESDPETQERIAREQHGMLKPGEHAFILEEPDDRQP